MRPDDLLERRTRAVHRAHRDRVGDGRGDLAAVPDDAGVGEQPLDVALGVAGDHLRVEAVEGLAERHPLAQDGDPREAGLEALEAQQLEQRPLVAQRRAPLAVVVVDVEGIVAAPPAPRVDLPLPIPPMDPLPRGG